MPKKLHEKSYSMLLQIALRKFDAKTAFLRCQKYIALTMGFPSITFIMSFLHWNNFK